jgi:formylglycine-generating enzyme required for sulfatase activity
MASSFQPGQRVVPHLPGGVPLALRYLPPGEFRMGSRGYHPDEEPVHRVRITHGFWLGETPVTQAQFAVWTRAAGEPHENHFSGRPEHPAENLDWRQANRFCAWLGGAVALPEALRGAGFGRFCLPTEAEWEYACRAGTETEHHTGDGEEALAQAGWFGEDWQQGSTHPVGLKQANPWGLQDLHGNVWEWCHDAWDGAAYRGRADGVADPGSAARAADWREGLARLVREDDGRHRVLRGGSWFDSARDCRAAYRGRYWPDARNRYRGFRVCLVPGPAAGGGGAPGQQQAEAAEAEEGAGRGTRPEPPGAAGAGAGVDLRRVRVPPRDG